MKRLLPILLLASGVVQADGFSSRAEWLFYGAQYSVDDTSPFNPGNTLINQPPNVASTELRPDLSWSGGELSINLKPRLLLEHSAQGRNSDLWMNEGNVRWRVRDDVTLAAGREVLLWGPAQFWNPSNPFYTDNGRANAKREVLGKTFARARWQLADGLNLHAISQIDNGHFKTGVERMDAVKLDWVGSEASAAALIAAEPGKSLQWRAWAQWTVDDAWLLYGEAAWVRRSARVPIVAVTPTGWGIDLGSDAYALDATLGAGYTFLNAWTLNVEYYRHGSGLSAKEFAVWNEFAGDVSRQITTNPFANVQLGAALSPGTSPLRRNYLGIQLRNGSDELIGWNLRYSRNLDDRSGQVVAQLSYDLSDRCQLWGNVMVQHGNERTEYGRWLNSTAMLGVTVFLW